MNENGVKVGASAVLSRRFDEPVPAMPLTTKADAQAAVSRCTCIGAVEMYPGGPCEACFGQIGGLPTVASAQAAAQQTRRKCVCGADALPKNTLCFECLTGTDSQSTASIAGVDLNDPDAISAALAAATEGQPPNYYNLKFTDFRALVEAAAKLDGKRMDAARLALAATGLDGVCIL